MVFKRYFIPAGRLRVEDRLGSGGAAVVYAVQEVSTGKWFALKVLHTLSSDARDRLRREAVVQASIASPHILPVLEAIEHQGCPAVLLPLADGCSVADLIRQYRLSSAESVALVVGILRGVAAAHAAGAIHRDLKPSNVLMDRVAGRWVPRVADFGIAKLAAESQDLTRTDGFVGTPRYAAPEQLAGRRDVGPETDLWAVGVMLYEFLTGERPFVPEDREGMLLATATPWTRDRAPAHLLPRFERFVPLLERLLVRDPTQRMSSATQVLESPLLEYDPSVLDLDSPLGRAALRERRDLTKTRTASESSSAGTPPSVTTLALLRRAGPPVTLVGGLTVLGVMGATTLISRPPPTPAERAAGLVREIQTTLRPAVERASRAGWLVDLSPTTENRKALIDAQVAANDWAFLLRQRAQVLEADPTVDPDIRRMLHSFVTTTPPLPPDLAQRREHTELIVEMANRWKDADHFWSASSYPTDLALDPNPNAQRNAWEAWQASAIPQGDRYARFVELSNVGARSAGLRDASEFYIGSFDRPPGVLRSELKRLWTEVEPLYRSLHCHVRARLAEEYGSGEGAGGLISEPLTRNRWGQDWTALFPLLAPYPDAPVPDIAHEMAQAGWDIPRMAWSAGDFYDSLGFERLPDAFWAATQLEKQSDEADCHEFTGADEDGVPRMKLCLQLDQSSLVKMHHELGHVVYNLQQDHLPALFRTTFVGGYGGIHEGIGEAVALSMTDAYFADLGLPISPEPDEQVVLDEQMRLALKKVPGMPFHLLVDLWRWDVLAGVDADRRNARWWDMKQALQGLAPPEPRDERYFDPGSKYHVANNWMYAQYFIADILQFQVFRDMCRASGHDGRLSACSLYGQSAAGDYLRGIMSLGATVPEGEVVWLRTTNRHLDASALLEYFAPLSAWLAEQNAGRSCGWDQMGIDVWGGPDARPG